MRKLEEALKELVVERDKVCLSICLSVCRCVCLSICASVGDGFQHLAYARGVRPARNLSHLGTPVPKLANPFASPSHAHVRSLAHG